jgi:hypothetical protein
MPLRFRPMQPKDIRECSEIIPAHPVIGPRYGRAMHDLREAWLRSLGYGSHGHSGVRGSRWSGDQDLRSWR